MSETTDRPDLSPTDDGGTLAAADIAVADPVAALQAELAAEREAMLRLRAETDNLVKRVRRDAENSQKFALERLIGELVPVLDSLEMGLGSAGEGNGTGLREGMDLTLRMFRQALEKYGVTALDPVGERFDPARHEAMAMQPAADGQEANSVLLVVQKGYELHGRLVRPARVIVSK
jgi:molecular chaperone GrpE